MVTPAIALATEDELSERIGERLLDDVGLAVELRLRRNGFGYLRSNINKLADLSKRQPVVLLTDLDQAPCPSELLRKWLGKRGKPEDLVFRVVVRQIEAWLLADRESLAELLGSTARRLPIHPELLPNSKQALLNLAKRAPRSIRDELIAAKGAIATQGLGYNSLLCEFAISKWSPARAELSAPSLERARRALESLADRVRGN